MMMLVVVVGRVDGWRAMEWLVHTILLFGGIHGQVPPRWSRCFCLFVAVVAGSLVGGKRQPLIRSSND